MGPRLAQGGTDLGLIGRREARGGQSAVRVGHGGAGGIIGCFAGLG